MTLLLCLGGAGIAFVLYDDATKIDRGSPDAAVDNYLRAYLVNRDDKEAALFRCKSAGDFAQLFAYRSDIEAREKQFAMTVRVGWTSLTVEGSGNNTTVSTELRRAVSDGSERISDRWQFRVVDEDGWRVCGATKVA
jgi:hypothetical protein